jgi:hypothetical protein
MIMLASDIDSPVTAKVGYTALLDLAVPRLAPGALVIAHDVCYPKFKNDLEPCMARVRDRSRFSATVTLPINQYGFEVTRVAGAPHRWSNDVASYVMRKIAPA